MANANIPLSVNQVDAVNPLLMLQQGQRQQRLDQQQAAESKQIGELRGAQLEGQNMQNQAMNQELQRSVLQNVARYGIAFNDLVQQDNLQAAGQVAQEMKRLMTQANIPTTDVDNLLRTFNNPQKLKQDSAAAVEAMKPHLAQLFGDVKNDSGQIIAQRNTQTGELKSVPDTLLGGSDYKNVTRLDNGAFVGLKDGKIQQIPQDDTAIAAFDAAQQVESTKAEIKAAGETFDKAQKIRSEISRATGDYQKIKGAYDRIQASAQDPSAAGDLALIFNYMKMLDPGSTVREGEFATAQNSGGVDDRIVSSYNKLLNGERLAPDQRDDFMRQSGSIFKKVQATNNAVIDGYVKLAEGFGLKRDQVVVGGLDTPNQIGRFQVEVVE